MMPGMGDYRKHPWRTLMADIGMSVFGMFMAVTPLLLWAAPDEAWFYFVVKACAISAVMVYALADLTSPAGVRPTLRWRGDKRRPRLPDHFVGDLHNLRQMGRSQAHQKTLHDYVANEDGRGR